jgi:hypothetical protein
VYSSTAVQQLVVLLGIEAAQEQVSHVIVCEGDQMGYM